MFDFDVVTGPVPARSPQQPTRRNDPGPPQRGTLEPAALPSPRERSQPDPVDA